MKVNSSNVESIGYSPLTRKLSVKFRGGDHYVYNDVPKGIHGGLMQAESVGGYLAKHVRGKFEHEKQ